nr:hypothetical protein [Thiomicrorhabdus sp.]
MKSAKPNSDAVPAEYVRRQTLKNQERYILPELKEFEDKILSAGEKALAREKWLYQQLLDRLNEELRPLQATAQALSELDVLNNLARQARLLNLWPPALDADFRHSDQARKTPDPSKRSRRNLLFRTISISVNSVACRSSQARIWAVNQPLCVKPL